MRLYTAQMTDSEYLQPLLALLFCLVGLANNLRRPCDVAIMAAGHYKQTQWRSLLESTINIVASIFFALKLGFVGVLAGGLVSYGYRTLDIIFYSNIHILKRNPARSLIKILLLTCIYIPLLFGISKIRIYPADYFGWFQNAFIFALVLGIPAMLIFFISKGIVGNLEK